MKIVLTIAGSDTSAGAGIQQDLKTITALGAYGATVITALTAQNTLGVQHVMPVPAEVVRAQIDAVMSDLCVDVVKIGMIPCLEVAQAVVTALSHWRAAYAEQGRGAFPIVWDPVMISTSGTRLMGEDCIAYLLRELIPLSALITPNLPESVFFADRSDANLLIKGGHAEGEEMTDRLLMADGSSHTFTASRIASNNLHGTGCTLSSAIAVFLSQRRSLPEAVDCAKQYLTAAIAAGCNQHIGHGNGPLGIIAWKA